MRTYEIVYTNKKGYVFALTKEAAVKKLLGISLHIAKQNPEFRCECIDTGRRVKHG